MKVTVTKVIEYSMEKQVMEDTEILTTMYQTQKIEIIGTLTTLTSTTVVIIKKIIKIIQVTTQNTVACMFHGNKTLVTAIITIITSYIIASKEISHKC